MTPIRIFPDPDCTRCHGEGWADSPIDLQHPPQQPCWYLLYCPVCVESQLDLLPLGTTFGIAGQASDPAIDFRHSHHGPPFDPYHNKKEARQLYKRHQLVHPAL